MNDLNVNDLTDGMKWEFGRLQDSRTSHECARPDIWTQPNYPSASAFSIKWGWNVSQKNRKKNVLTYFTSAMWVTITVFTEEINQNDDATFAGVCTKQAFFPSSSGGHDLQAEASLWQHIAQFMMPCCDTFTTFYNAAPAILELCDTINNNAVPTQSLVTRVTSLTHKQRLQQPYHLYTPSPPLSNPVSCHLSKLSFK